MQYHVGLVRGILSRVGDLLAQLRSWLAAGSAMFILTVAAPQSASATAAISLSVAVSPHPSVEFALVNYSGMSPPNYSEANLTITNVGTESVWSPWWMMNNTRFVVTGHNCSNLDVGQSCAMTLRYTPTSISEYWVASMTLGFYGGGLPYSYPVQLYARSNTPSPGTLTLTSPPNTASFNAQAFGVPVT